MFWSLCLVQSSPSLPPCLLGPGWWRWADSGEILPVQWRRARPGRWDQRRADTIFFTSELLKMHVSFCGWIPRCGCGRPCSRHVKNKCKKRERGRGNLEKSWKLNTIISKLNVINQPVGLKKIKSDIWNRYNRWLRAQKNRDSKAVKK